MAVVGTVTKKHADYNSIINVNLSQFDRLSTGVYILRILGKDWIKTEKVVAENWQIF